ncbi:MAG: hypothetical protein JOZ54_23415 [Acidobacteria bacterium]|nr:hypothetical protein [Acidobacteriota bacterium]
MTAVPTLGTWALMVMGAVSAMIAARRVGRALKRSQ